MGNVERTVDRTIKRPVNRKRALEIIGQYPSSRVLVIGDLMVDHFIWGKVSRISPEAPVPVVEVTKENLMMGGSGNVVSNIHAMGGTVAVAGIIGSDGMGDWLEAKLQQMNVDTGGLVREGRAAHDGEDEDRRPRAADGPLRPGEPARRPSRQRRPHRPVCHVHPGRAFRPS